MFMVESSRRMDADVCVEVALVFTDDRRRRGRHRRRVRRRWAPSGRRHRTSSCGSRRPRELSICFRPGLQPAEGVAAAAGAAAA